MHCTDIRDSCNDEKYEHAIGRLKGLKDVEIQDLFWHRGCYSEFTKEGHIQRLQKQGTDKSEENGAEVSVSRKSSLDRTDWSKCMFCQKDPKVYARYKRRKHLKKYSEMHQLTRK